MKNKKENLKGVDQSELEKKLEVLRESARIMRFKMEGTKSKNVKEMGSIKKQIARVLTEINHAKGRASK